MHGGRKVSCDIARQASDMQIKLNGMGPLAAAHPDASSCWRRWWVSTDTGFPAGYLTNDSFLSVDLGSLGCTLRNAAPHVGRQRTLVQETGRPGGIQTHHTEWCRLTGCPRGAAHGVWEDSQDPALGLHFPEIMLSPVTYWKAKYFSPLKFTCVIQRPQCA